MQLSVIIPVYNVRDYLVRCVESVVAECKSIEYEILLVDDGSKDGSGDLCDELAGQYPSITVLHKPNGGLSDARNYGVTRASGEYVFYLDSDDYLVKNGLKSEFVAAYETGSDVVCGNFYYKYADRLALFNENLFDTISFDGGEPSLRALVDGKYYQNFAWGKLIRRELAVRNLFPKGKLFEDTYWFHHILDQANKVTVVNHPVVYYEQRDGSISFEYKLKSLDILDGYTERLHFFESKYPALVDAHKQLMARNCLEQAWMIVRYLRGEEYDTAVLKLRNTISECNLQHNKLLKRYQRRNLQLIIGSMLMFEYCELFTKVVNKIIK